MSCNALIVGINQYKILPQLNLPATDATAIANALGKHDSFKISYLPEIVNQDNQLAIDPSRFVKISELKEALKKFFTPNSQQIPTTALFYFAGHGILDASGGVNEGYLCAHNSHPADDHYGLSLTWLRKLLENSPIPKKIVWLDCCHSGALLNFEDAKPNTGNYCFIAASRDYEVAYENGSHGVLTNALLRGLDCSNKSEITADDLITFVKETLKGETQETLTHSSGGRIVLVRNPHATAPRPAIKAPEYQKGALLINATFFDLQKTEHASATNLKPAFYGGKKAVQWYGIVQNLDAPRQAYQAAQQAIIQGFDQENAVAALIKGDGGSGKSVLLRRLAHDFCADYRVYWLEDIAAFLEGEWQYELNKHPADHSTQTIIFLEDWYQHIENSQLEKEAAELLRKVSRTNVRLVIGDRFAKNNHKKSYETYVSKRNVFELSANENLSLLETIFIQMPEWKEKTSVEQIEKSANASLFQLLFIFQYAEDMSGSITDIYQRIFASDCRAMSARSEFWHGMAKALYFYAHLYTREGVTVTLDFLSDLAAYFAGCAIPNLCTIEVLANDPLLKKYFGLDVAHSKRFGVLNFFRFHHDTMADKGWMWVDELIGVEYNATLLQAVIQHFQSRYPWLIGYYYFGQIKQGGVKGKVAARKFLKTDKPWEIFQAFSVCLTLLKDEAKDAARTFLKTDQPWEIKEAFSNCLTLLKGEEIAKDAARAFLKTDQPWEIKEAFSNCLTLLKDEPEGISHAVYILQNRAQFTAPHHWPLLYHSLEALNDKPMYQSLVSVVANEIINQRKTIGYQYGQLLKFPLFYVPQWVTETENCIRNWQKPSFKKPDRPWISRNAINFITIGYKKKPALLKAMCIGIVLNWQFELRIEQKYQAYFIRCLAHPAIQKDSSLRQTVVMICQTILSDHSQPPLQINDGTRIWLENIAERNQFPEWENDL